MRCARIVKVVLKGRGAHGLLTLVKGGETDEPSFPAAHVSMAQSVDDAWLFVLNKKLGRSTDWLQRCMTLTSCAETVVEVKTSDRSAGLPSWYIVEEVEVCIAAGAYESSLAEFASMGLPFGADFIGRVSNKHSDRSPQVWAWRADGDVNASAAPRMSSLLSLGKLRKQRDPDPFHLGDCSGDSSHPCTDVSPPPSRTKDGAHSPRAGNHSPRARRTKRAVTGTANAEQRSDVMEARASPANPVTSSVISRGVCRMGLRHIPPAAARSISPSFFMAAADAPPAAPGASSRRGRSKSPT